MIWAQAAYLYDSIFNCWVIANRFQNKLKAKENQQAMSKLRI